MRSESNCERIKSKLVKESNCEEIKRKLVDGNKYEKTGREDREEIMNKKNLNYKKIQL